MKFILSCYKSTITWKQRGSVKSAIMSPKIKFSLEDLYHIFSGHCEPTYLKCCGNIIIIIIITYSLKFSYQR